MKEENLNLDGGKQYPGNNLHEKVIHIRGGIRRNGVIISVQLVISELDKRKEGGKIERRLKREREKSKRLGRNKPLIPKKNSQRRPIE